MHAPATVAGTFDGIVDEGLEQRPGRAGGSRRAAGDVGAEAAAHALLRLVAEHPGQMGRLRASRIIGGYPVPHREDEASVDLQRYAVELDWPLREITRLVDAVITGRLVAQTPGPRPVLVLTRAGHRALDALEATPQP